MTQYSGKVIRKTPVTPTQQSASGVWKLNEQAAAIRNNSWPVPGVPDPISRSVRLRSSASAYFNRTLASSGTTATFSAWVKRGALGTASTIFGTTDASTYDFQITFTASNTIEFYALRSSVQVFDLITTAVYRDPSAWYHIVAVVNTTNATSTNRVQLYVNGVQVTAFGTASYPSQNAVTPLADSRTFGLGNRGNANNNYFDGYLTEINFIDGQALTPSSFGTTDTATGAWIPMAYTGTYGANGFYLNFKDNTNTTTLGLDYSGNANNWTTNNISLTAGTTYDSMLDVPTPWIGYNTSDASAVTRGNYCVLSTLNDLFRATVSGANLDFYLPGGTGGARCRSNWSVESGKWYWESVVSSVGSYPNNMRIGLSPDNVAGLPLYIVFGTGVITTGGYGTLVANGTSYANGDIIQVAFDRDSGKLWFGKNGTWSNSGNPAAGTNENVNSISTSITFNAGWDYNVTASAASGSVNFGQRPLSYTPPTGFKTLCTTNLPTPTITNGANYMAATTYSGNSSTQTVTNGGNNTTGTTFKPDFVWVKSRNVAGNNHNLWDSVRGAGKLLLSNLTDSEYTIANMTGFASNGFSFSGVAADSNTTGNNLIAWQWKAGAGTTSSNTSGSITSTVSVNQTAGFSVVTYTGTGVNATVGHGLGVAPSMMIFKVRSTTNDWLVYHKSVGATGYLLLDTTAATATSALAFNNTAPTSSVFTISTGNAVNANAATYVAYCWAAVDGYSAFGSYTGNGSTDGPFVYCGFRPRFVMVKNSSTTGRWINLDTSRDTYNLTQQVLYPNYSNAEAAGGTTFSIDILSNGFKCRGTDVEFNASGQTMIFAAFAENPFKYSNAR